MGLMRYAMSGNFSKFSNKVKVIADKENISYFKIMFKFFDLIL